MKKEAPKFIKKPANLEIYEHEDATFEAEISAVPKPTVTWNIGDKQVKPDDRHLYTTENQVYTFTIKDAQVKEGTTYTVRAKNDAGEQFAQARLKVLRK